MVRRSFGGASRRSPFDRDAVTLRTMRSLSGDFLDSLRQGCLAALTETVRSDGTLNLELRGDYVNVYYRGGNLLEVRQSQGSAGDYAVHFDTNYFGGDVGFALPNPVVRQPQDLSPWLAACPRLKQAIDRWLACVKRNPEREIQQLAVRDNNFGAVARDTDYFVCDIEYQSEHGRFDMIAVRWPSTPAHRRRANGRRLAFVEFKYGDRALDNLHDHVRHVNRFVADTRRLSDFKRDMVRVFNQKLGLQLIDCGKELSGFGDERPMLILAFANHDPQKTALTRLLGALPASPHVDLRIATASFLGYGLYDQGIHSVETVQGRFSKYLLDTNRVA